ncbi:MAG TPA: cellulase family glycosylhydrolase [Ktedonobacteraceae bacterium]|nr:cellulase family glycosylhydrolase [Ktedonobacteraceae bacterium]
MFFLRKWILPVAVLLIIFSGIASFWFVNAASHANAASSLPYHMTAAGPYHTQGNQILDAQGQPYLFHGLGRDGLEYNCAGDGPLDAQHLAYMGPGTNVAGGTYWWGNTIRLPISEGFWLHGDAAHGCTAAQYQALVKTTVATINSLNLNAILDLQWVDAGGNSPGSGSSWPMPDADSVTFWQQAATLYKSSPNVLFEIYNEPNPANWACWQTGCSVTSTSYSSSCNCQVAATYQAVGMQTLVNTIRGAGATNLVLAAGSNWGFDLSGVSSKGGLTGSNIVYDTHPYPYQGKMTTADWDASFGPLSANAPVISTESGSYDCKSTFETSLLSYLDSHQIGWLGWAWSVQGAATSVCGYPQVITDYQGTPAATMGQTEYQHLLSYVPAGTQPPAPPAPAKPTTPAAPTGPTAPAPPVSANNPPPLNNPTSKTWYFAEGRVGANFTEYLTMSNPSTSVDCPVSIQYLLSSGKIIPKSVTVPHASRVTESVNQDLNLPANRAGAADVSTILSAGASCPGIVAERPMYFNWHGIASGSDVVGATHLGQSFYFADVPSGSGYSSFVTILNPPGGSVATITAGYYAGGRQIGHQSITLQPGSRGTLSPASAALPAHTALVVESNQPVMVERPVYFANVAAGNAGTVSGAASVAGAQALAKDWLFAEGYTGGRFQENLVIANLDTAALATANVTINIEYDNGTKKTFTVPVGPMSQVIWNVNQNAAAGNISADVSAAGANIVVERELYYQYSHSIVQSNGFQVGARGGSDVIGQVGPASTTTYNFAEGYSNKGYNEWLTLQNPTSATETIYLTLRNGYGRVYSPPGIQVPAASRHTVDITAMVLQALVRAGDDHRGYEVSLTAYTTGGAFVAERPMYSNTGGGGTQGGTDVIGYTA